MTLTDGQDAELASRLEARLLEKPTDREAAARLAEVWTRQHDPRGEALAIELALAAPDLDPKEATALDRRLLDLSLGEDRVRAGSGGFPFRSQWSERPWVFWTVRGRLEGPTFYERALKVANLYARREPLFDGCMYESGTFAEARSEAAELAELREEQGGSVWMVGHGLETTPAKVRASCAETRDAFAFHLRFLLSVRGRRLAAPFAWSPATGWLWSHLAFSRDGDFALKLHTGLLEPGPDLHQIHDDVRRLLGPGQLSEHVLTLAQGPKGISLLGS